MIVGTASARLQFCRTAFGASGSAFASSSARARCAAMPDAPAEMAENRLTYLPS
jgi:hypothetical protein